MNLRNKNKKASRDIAVMVTATRVLFYRLRYAALALVAASVAATATVVGALSADPALAATAMTVDSTADNNAADTVLTLREAILLANGGVGGNGTTTGLGRGLEEEEYDNLSGAIPGAGSVDTITFSDPPFAVANPGVITLSTPLPYLTGGSDTIDGLGRGVRIDGAGEPSAFSCITIDSAFNTVKGLQLTDCTNGVWVVPDANVNTIGPGNTAYDNQVGFAIGGNGNTVKGNMIGVTPDGANVHPDGSNSRGIAVSGDNNVIGGIAGTSPGVLCTGACNLISGNSVGIELQLNAVDTVIKGNFIGTDLTGTLDRGNLGEGVLIRDASNVVGGYGAAEGNLISGNNGYGVNLFGSAAIGNTIWGNKIGTNAAGTAAVPNDFGVNIQSGSGNHVGVVTVGGGNVISGNQNTGVRIAGPGNFVEANLIGTTASGTASLGNGNQGVRVENAANTKIAWNVVAANGDAGIRIEGSSQGTAIESNFIGTNTIGTTGLGNSTDGVYLNSNSTTVGGFPEDGNTIAFNGGDGIHVGGTMASVIANNAIHHNAARGVGLWGGTGHQLSRNVIWDNGGLGIDVVALPEDFFGVTANDGAPDADSGPNSMQNYPVIDLIDLDNVSNIQGTLDSTPNTTFTLQFYYGSYCDASGHGEGRNFLVQGSVGTDGNGHGTFKVFFSTPPEFFIPSQFVSATATDPAGNTSEFSQCKAAWDDADDDNDGFPDSDETLTIGTNAGYPCGFNGWPADLWDQPPLSANKITVQDLTAFIAPVRRLGTSPGDANFNARWDLVPGKGIFSVTINVQDMTKLVTLAPPMLNLSRALNGPLCPMPSQ